VRGGDEILGDGADGQALAYLFADKDALRGTF
jgi:hypothetical protein